MKQKQQIMHIHGGESFNSHKEYLKNLKTRRCNPFLDTSYRWQHNYLKYLRNNYEIIIPKMPCQQNAHYNEWKVWFKRHIEFLRDDIILVGHSLGGNFLAKYLSENKLPVSIKQLHLVAPSHSAFEDDFKITEFPKNFFNNDIRNIHIYHSTDDTVVPISESKKYHAELPDSRLHIFDDRFHFLDETFPELFDIILN